MLSYEILKQYEHKYKRHEISNISQEKKEKKKKENSTLHRESFDCITFWVFEYAVSCF